MELTTPNLRQIHGVRLIRLTGTREERAIQHGRIIAALKPEERDTLALQPLSTKNQTLVKRAAGRIPGISSLFETFYDAFVFRQYRNLPKEYRNRLKPFAKHAHLSTRKLWLSLYQPDLLMVLAAMAHEKVRNQFVSGMPGCTSGVIEKNGETLFLRNLDYPAASHWEKWPTVFYHEPSDAQRFVSVSSLGIHTAGLTGWNESGIVFSLHAHFSKQTSLTGVPIFFLGEDIMETARTFEEAVHICKKFKTIGSWAINLMSLKERKGATIELSNESISVHPMNSEQYEKETEQQILAHSNGFNHGQFKEHEIYFSGAFFEDIRARKLGLDSALKKNPDLRDAITALASHHDYQTGFQRVFGNTVSVVTTIQSMVIQASTQSCYLSIRQETPTPFGPFLKIPFRWEDVAACEANPELVMPKTEFSESFIHAVHAYHQAYVAWQVSDQPVKKAAEQTHSFLIQATEFEPEDPHLWMQRGYFELIHREGKMAQECFTTALKFALSPHLQTVARYFLAICSDLLGDRAQALEIYQTVLTTQGLDEKLKKKAEKRLNRPFQWNYCQKIEPDLQYVEPLQYP